MTADFGDRPTIMQPPDHRRQYGVGTQQHPRRGSVRDRRRFEVRKAVDGEHEIRTFFAPYALDMPGLYLGEVSILSGLAV